MKKKSIFCLFICLLMTVGSFNTLTAFAGMPPYVPVYELILIDSNDALSIRSQTIIIAPPSVIREPYSHYSPNMPDSLSTIYEIENNAAAVRSQIAVLHFDSLFGDLSRYELNANGSVLSPTVYYKHLNPLWDRDIDDYSAILDDAYCEPVFYDDSLCGTQYVFTTAPLVPIRFTLTANQKIIYSANSISSTHGVGINTSGALAASSGVVTIFVTGGALDYNCESTFEVESSVISYNNFITELDFPLPDDSAVSSSLFISNAFDSFLNGYNDMLTFSDLYDAPYCKILVYEVDFLAGANTLSLVRPLRYTYSYDYEPPLFALHIKHAPLKTWSECRTTNIEITTPPDIPYIIDDDLCFQKTKDNSYSFSGDITSLDEYYIVFCSVENPQPAQPLNRYVWQTILIIICIVLSSIAVVVLVVCIVLTVRDKKRRC